MPWSGRGSTRAWRVKRARILRRDNYQCRLRIGRVCTGRANSVHHLYGTNHEDDQDLVAACMPCNQHIGDPTRHRHRSPTVTGIADPEPVSRTQW